MSIYDRDLLSGRNKVETAIERLKLHCAGKKVLCAFSGGKDSQCVYHLLKMSGIEFDAQYSITRFEPPELLGFIRKNYKDVSFRRAYKMPLIKEIERSGLPSRWFRWCCTAKHTKTEGYDIAAIGIRWAESARRRMRWNDFGRKEDGTFYCCPIIDWTDADVWEFLNGNNIPHCSLYDEGFKRIGCVCCPLSPDKGDEVRWPKTAALLKLGFMKYSLREDFKSEKTNELCKKYRNEIDKYFGYWLKYGTTEPKDALENDEPCLFAGTGFSESDGAAEE